MKVTLAIVSAALLLASPAAYANSLYAKYCASCHGSDGKGNTKMGKKTGAADYTSAKGQAWSDSQGVKITLNGKGKMKGFKSKISEADAKALVTYIRRFKK